MVDTIVVDTVEKPKEDKINEAMNKTYNNDEVIPKKVAALEMFRRTKVSRMLAGTLFVVPFIAVIINTFSSLASSIFAGIMAIGASFLIWKDTQYLKYLIEKYNLK